MLIRDACGFAEALTASCLLRRHGCMELADSQKALGAGCLLRRHDSAWSLRILRKALGAGCLLRRYDSAWSLRILRKALGARCLLRRHDSAWNVRIFKEHLLRGASFVGMTVHGTCGFSKSTYCGVPPSSA